MRAGDLRTEAKPAPREKVAVEREADQVVVSISIACADTAAARDLYDRVRKQGLPALVPSPLANRDGPFVSSLRPWA